MKAHDNWHSAVLQLAVIKCNRGCRLERPDYLSAFNTLEGAAFIVSFQPRFWISVDLFRCRPLQTLYFLYPLCHSTTHEKNQKEPLFLGRVQKKSLSSIFRRLFFPHCCLGRDSCLRLAAMCHKPCCTLQLVGDSFHPHEWYIAIYLKPPQLNITFKRPTVTVPICTPDHLH